MRDGRVTGFRTCMTCEFYSLLSQHSILARTLQAQGIWFQLVAIAEQNRDMQNRREVERARGYEKLRGTFASVFAAAAAEGITAAEIRRALSGLRVRPVDTTCTWTVTVSHATAPVRLRASDFDALDHRGIAYRVAGLPGGPGVPAILEPGRTATFALRAAMPTGEGMMRWSAGTGEVLRRWSRQRARSSPTGPSRTITIWIGASCCSSTELRKACSRKSARSPPNTGSISAKGSCTAV